MLILILLIELVGADLDTTDMVAIDMEGAAAIEIFFYGCVGLLRNLFFVLFLFWFLFVCVFVVDFFLSVQAKRPAPKAAIYFLI